MMGFALLSSGDKNSQNKGDKNDSTWDKTVGSKTDNDGECNVLINMVIIMAMMIIEIMILYIQQCQQIYSSGDAINHTNDDENEDKNNMFDNNNNSTMIKLTVLTIIENMAISNFKTYKKRKRNNNDKWGIDGEDKNVFLLD